MTNLSPLKPPFKDPGTIHEKVGWFLCVGVPIAVAAFSYYILNFTELVMLEKFLLRIAGIVIVSVLAGMCTWLRGVYLYRKAIKEYRESSKPVDTL